MIGGVSLGRSGECLVVDNSTKFTKKNTEGQQKKEAVNEMNRERVARPVVTRKSAQFVKATPGKPS